MEEKLPLCLKDGTCQSGACFWWRQGYGTCSFVTLFDPATLEKVKQAAPNGSEA